MIFVNTLEDVQGMPSWLYHTPENSDGLTFPDLVFPAFLFIVGMSIPFATAQRLAAGDTVWRLLRHVLMRTLGLLVLGVFMVDAEEGYNERAMPLSIGLWSLLLHIGAHGLGRLPVSEQSARSRITRGGRSRTCCAGAVVSRRR